MLTYKQSHVWENNLVGIYKYNLVLLYFAYYRFQELFTFHKRACTLQKYFVKKVSKFTLNELQLIADVRDPYVTDLMVKALVASQEWWVEFRFGLGHS